MKSLRAVALCIAAAGAVPAAAQVEIVPFGGYRFGGDLSLAGEPAALEIRDSAAWGVSVTYQVTEDGELEAVFARQGTRLDAGGFFTSDPRFDLAIETYQLGGNYLFGEDHHRLRPYIGAALGVSRLVPEPDALEAETRFSASFAAGLKAYVTTHFGFRFEVRGFFTFLDSNSTVFCRSQAGCLINAYGSEISQAEARGGLIFRF
jgi:outer membrane protein W